MKKVKRFLRNIVELVLLVAPVMAILALFQPLTVNLSPSAAKLAQTQPAYPPPDELAPASIIPGTPAPYPPSDWRVPVQITLGTPGSDQVTPIFPLPSETPWPTFTPYPSPTLRSGPSPTPIPLAQPAKDASGNLQYMVRQKDGMLAIQSLPLDAAGQPKSSALQVARDVIPGEVFPSPDGSRLAIVGDWSACLIFDGINRELKPLPEAIGPYEEQFYNWFPDSRQILIRANSGSLWLADPYTGDNVRLAVPGYGIVSGAAASPDGGEVIYSYRFDITSPVQLWMVNVNGRDEKLLFEVQFDITHLTWSPDGKRIAFLGDGLMVMNRDGTDLHIVGMHRFPLGYNLPPVWSPDSRQLAYISAGTIGPQWNEKAFEEANIYLVDAESGEERPLLTEDGSGSLDPTWSPDGSQIAFISNRDGSIRVWAVNVDGSNLHPLTPAGNFVRFPSWRKP